MSLSMKLEQILVQKLVSSQAKKSFKKRDFQVKYESFWRESHDKENLRKSMLRLFIWGKTATNSEKLQVQNFLTQSRDSFTDKNNGKFGK